MAQALGELKKACEKGDLREVTRIVKRDPKAANATDGVSQTPLFYAAWKGHTDVVQLLLKNKADVHTEDKWKCTPLTYATACGHLACTQFLVEKAGADPVSKDALKKTPLDYAKKYKHKAVVAYLQGLRRDDSAAAGLPEEKGGVEKKRADAKGEGKSSGDGKGPEDEDDDEEFLLFERVMDDFQDADGFSAECQEFAREHCAAFDPDAEEHKLEYTALHFQFQEQYEARLSALIARATDGRLSVDKFQDMCTRLLGPSSGSGSGGDEKKDTADGFVSLILAITDYETFVNLMKDTRSGTGIGGIGK